MSIQTQLIFLNLIHANFSETNIIKNN